MGYEQNMNRNLLIYQHLFPWSILNIISTFIHIPVYELIPIIVIHNPVYEFIQYNYTAYRDSLPSYTMSNASQDLLQVLLLVLVSGA